MKYRYLILLSVVVSLFGSVALTSCASSDAEMSAFVGQPSSELLARLGPPRLRAPGENGGQVWTYEEESRGAAAQSGPSFPGTMNNGVGGSSSRTSALSNPAFSSKKVFYIDSSGTIINYRGRAR